MLIVSDEARHPDPIESSCQLLVIHPAFSSASDVGSILHLRRPRRKPAGRRAEVSDGVSVVTTRLAEGGPYLHSPQEFTIAIIDSVFTTTLSVAKPAFLIAAGSRLSIPAAV